jgi:hypothetical protein
MFVEVLVFWSICSALSAVASPYYPNPHDTILIRKRDNRDDQDGKFPIWIPIVILAATSVVLVVYSWGKRTTQTTSTPVVQNNRPATGITAEVRPPRPRRARRTASQRSTRSLPAYMEEPGDEELVLVARQRDTPETLLEEDEDSPRNTGETERPYSLDHPGAASSIDISAPLMHVEDRYPTQSSRHSRNLSSLSQGDEYDHNQSSASFNVSEQDLTTANITDPSIAGGTPPGYFEVVGEGASGQTPNATIQASDNTPAGTLNRSQTSQTTDTSTSTHSRSTSVFSLRTLFGRRGSTADGTAASSVQIASPTSTDRTQMADVSPSSPSMVPRPRPSISNLNPLNRITSNSSSNSPSPTPSRIISAPLAHTVVRTEFAFPKAGPTPQQVSFLTSRESLVRFGVPFGVEAEAASQAALRQRLLDETNPPPPFESPMTEHAADSIAGDRTENDDASSHRRSRSSSNASNTRSIRPESIEIPPRSSPRSQNDSLPSPSSDSIHFQEGTLPPGAAPPQVPSLSVTIPSSRSIRSLRASHLSPIAGSPIQALPNEAAAS